MSTITPEQPIINNPIKRLFLSEAFVFTLILLNAILIFVQGYKIQGDWKNYLEIADDVMSIIFLIEAMVKLNQLGFKEYWGSNWNRFDLFLVLISLPSIVFRMIPGMSLNLNILLILRVFRVFKFFRFIKFFPQVEHIFKSAQRAVKASFMVLAGFFVLVFIMSILFCYLLRDYSPVSFGNPLIAYYSTFQVFTIEGWNAIPAAIDLESIANNTPLSPTATFFMRIMFIITFIVGGVFGLSIVNSLFVDAMVSNSNENAEEDVEKIRTELNVLNAKLDRIIAATNAQQVDETKLRADAHAQIEAEDAAKEAAEAAEKERQRREYGK